MCGIVGAIAEREVSKILIEGLKRLEYRGYDSAGVALINTDNPHLDCTKAVGKVEKLVNQVARRKTTGNLGIAHTRWATHGKPTVKNAHPHTSSNLIALVHNGIIENYEKLRSSLGKAGYEFVTETDTEVIAHLIHKARKGGKVDLVDAVKEAVKQLEGFLQVLTKSLTNADDKVNSESVEPFKNLTDK
jgi:glucosamine--fructose-6-phosphate aminotransferase (isomerizing)